MTTAQDIEDAVLIGRIESLADRLELRGRANHDGDLSEAADLLRLMVKAYGVGRMEDDPDDGEDRRSVLH
jgi:hypothetical protein